MKNLVSFLEETEGIGEEEFLEEYPFPFLITSQESLKNIRFDEEEEEEDSNNSPGFSTTSFDTGDLDVVHLWLAEGWVFFVESSKGGSRQMVNIGRTVNNDIVIPLPLISKFHCCILHDGEEASLIEGGSTNGTFVNKEKVDSEIKPKVPLKNGDTISFGESLEFEFYFPRDLYRSLPLYRQIVRSKVLGE